MFCHNDMIYLWLTPIVRRRLNWKWLVLPTLPTSRSVRNLFRWKKTFFTTKVFLLISSSATPSSAGDWWNSRGCHSCPVQPNPAGWGGSRCALCPGLSHVISCHIISYHIILYHGRTYYMKSHLQILSLHAFRYTGHIVSRWRWAPTWRRRRRR